MTLSEINIWSYFDPQMPESLRPFFECLKVICLFLLMFRVIFKVFQKILRNIFSKEYKKFYRLIGAAGKKAGQIGKAVAMTAARNIELPGPYPRLQRFFAIFFMINGYLLSFFFVCFAFFLVVLLSLSGSQYLSFWLRIGCMLFLVLLVYFAWFFFVQSEKDRINICKKSDLDKEIDRDND